MQVYFWQKHKEWAKHVKELSTVYEKRNRSVPRKHYADYKFKFKCLFFKPHMEEYDKITVNVISKTYNITHINVYIIIQSITVFFTSHFLK